MDGYNTTNPRLRTCRCSLCRSTNHSYRNGLHVLPSGISSIDGIRQAILAKLAEQGCDLTDMHEAILIRGGAYCGRRFECNGGSAVWFIEENQIKYYGATGELLHAEPSPRVPPVVVQPRRAA
jgi:hypothetical protein